MVFIITVPIFWDFLENIFNLKLGAEVWIYTFIVLSLVEFIIMLVILSEVQCFNKEFYIFHLLFLFVEKPLNRNIIITTRHREQERPGPTLTAPDIANELII